MCLILFVSQDALITVLFSDVNIEESHYLLQNFQPTVIRFVEVMYSSVTQNMCKGNVTTQRCVMYMLQISRRIIYFYIVPMTTSLKWMFKDFSTHLLREVVLGANWLKLHAASHGI
jgi:hypothetical protein